MIEKIVEDYDDGNEKGFVFVEENRGKQKTPEEVGE